MRPLRTVARTMLAAIFVSEGITALRNPDRLVGPAKPITDRLAPTLKSIHPKVPTDPKTLIRVNAATQIAAGALLATGKAARPAALVLAGSLVPTTLAGYQFWNAENPTQRHEQLTGFLKNASILGGLIIAALDTEGRPGLAWRAGALAGRAVTATQREAKGAQKAAKRAAKTAKREAKLAMLSARQSLPG